MQTGDGVEMPIVAEYRKTMLQRAGCNPHVIGRNGTAAASEFPIHHRILRRRLSVDYQLVHPLRRQELLQFLAISRLTRAYGKTAEQLTNTILLIPIRGVCVSTSTASGRPRLKAT